MATKKTEQPPAPANKATTGGGGRQRGSNGRFVKGVSGNPCGRPKQPEELRLFAREASMLALKRLQQIVIGSGKRDSDVIGAARLLLEYGYGKPAAEIDWARLDLDKQRVELERKRTEAMASGDTTAAVEVVFDTTIVENGWAK